MKLTYKNYLFLSISFLISILLSACNSGNSPSSSIDSANVPSNWNLLGISQNQGGDNFIGAWKLIDQLHRVPGESVTVAVIDTGYTPHANFISNLQSYNELNVYGYQFISSCFISGSIGCDAGGDIISPESNGLDLGDFHSAGECNETPPRNTNSSWHGSHVTGTIIGQGQESMYGGAYGAKVVPVRVLGKCGGTDSDISDAIMWAIGKHPNIPNPNPADIINMSLGGEGLCPSTYQQAIDQAIESGVVVVVAAGNETKDVSGFTPANCKGVISVAALSHYNTAASYSNYGNVTIAASGGGGRYSKGILSTIWNSVKGYNISDGGGYQEKSGTSMAAPGVTAAIADIISLLKAYNITYTPGDIKGIITSCANQDFKRYYNDPNKVISSLTGRLDVESAIQCVINTYPQIKQQVNNI